MLTKPGCIFAFKIENQSVGTIRWDEVHTLDRSKITYWVHMNRTAPEMQRWLREDASLESSVSEALLASSTRPRLESSNEGILMTLRGVNLNEGAEPSDMISLRLWVEPNRLLTLERERLLSVAAVAERLQELNGIRSTGEILVAIIVGLTDKMGPVIDEINDSLEIIEDRVIDPKKSVDRSDLIELRQHAIMLHRHLRPQVQTIQELYHLKLSWIDVKQHKLLKETINRVTRFVEDLDTVRDRATIIQDELANRYAETMNQRMYAVSLIATILLPMTILTGLLGINVGGIPMAQSPLGFTFVTVSLVIMGVGGFWLAKWLKWL